MNRAPDLAPTLRRLGLTTIAAHYEEMAAQAARDQLGPVEYLQRLADAEAAARYERSVQRRIKQARLPLIKTLEQFSWSWPAKINRPQIQDLFRRRFVEQNTNVVFIGGVHIYRMLRYGQAYVDEGIEAYEARFDQRRLHSIRDIARSLGYDLVPAAAGGEVSG